MHQTARRITIADVAKAAGVSKAAVSFAFNSPERLSADTVARIREIATTMDYRPDPVARMLAQRRTGTVGVLTPHGLDVMFVDPYFGTFVAGVAGEAEAAGYSLQFISPLHGSLARAVHEASVDGVIAVGLWPAHPEMRQIRRSGLPFVLVDATAHADESNVTIDDEEAATLAAEHLIALGHREVAVLAFAPPTPEEDAVASDDVSARRLRGYRRAFRAAGSPLQDRLLTFAPSDLELGAAAFRALLASGERPTAVLAMSDLLAMSVLLVAREVGWRVPDDLSVVGFDDIELAAFTHPPLTTVHQSVREKGSVAMRLLLPRLGRMAPQQPVHRHLPTRLVVRDSTGPAPRARQEVGPSDG